MTNRTDLEPKKPADSVVEMRKSLRALRFRQGLRLFEARQVHGSGSPAFRKNFRRAWPCGNVFADLGIPDPEEALAKAELAKLICGLIDARGLEQVQAAKILGVDQAKVSALVHGRLNGFQPTGFSGFSLGSIATSRS